MSEETTKKNDPTLSGIGVPTEVFANPELTQTDKLLFGFLQNLAKRTEGCTASNRYLGNCLFLKEQAISNSINTLIQWKYITAIYKKKYPHRSIYINTDREKMYKDLVHTFNDNFRDLNNDTLLEKLYTPIKKIIGVYNLNVNNKSSDVSSNKNVSPYGETCAVAQSSLHDKSFSGKRKKIPLQKSLPISSSESVKESLSKTPTSLSVHKSKKEIQPLSIPKNVQEIFDYWNEMGLQHLPSIGTKNYNDCIHKAKGLLNGTIFGTKFSMEQIKKSIMHFSLAALDREFEPANLITKKRFSKTTIGDFIYNSFRTNGDSSLFKKYLDAPKENPTREIIKDKFPQITNALKTFYRKEVVGGAKINFTQKDENCFRSGAIQLKEFIQNNIRKLNPYVVPHDSNLAEWLCEAIKADCKEDMSIVSPAWFASGTTFNRRLPAYLYRQALIDDSRGGVITGTLGDAGADDLQIFY